MGQISNKNSLISHNFLCISLFCVAKFTSEEQNFPGMRFSNFSFFPGMQNEVNSLKSDCKLKHLGIWQTCSFS